MSSVKVQLKYIPGPQSWIYNFCFTMAIVAGVFFIAVDVFHIGTISGYHYRETGLISIAIGMIVYFVGIGRKQEVVVGETEIVIKTKYPWKERVIAVALSDIRDVEISLTKNLNIILKNGERVILYKDIIEVSENPLLEVQVSVTGYLKTLSRLESEVKKRIKSH